MKVAFFVHCFFPEHFYGTETYTLELAKHYQAAGHEVTVVTAVFQGEPRQAETIVRYPFQGINVVRIDKNLLPHTRVKETYYQPDMRDVLTRTLQELRPDVVHVTHLINHTAALLEVCHSLQIPAFATFTDFFGFCLNNKLETANGELCRGPSRSRSNCVACHFSALAQNLDAPAHLVRTKKSGLLPLLASGLTAARKMPGIQRTAMGGLLEDIVQRPATLMGLYNQTYRAAVAPTHFLRTAYESNGLRVPLHDIRFGVEIDRSPKPVRIKSQRPVVGYVGQIAPHKGVDLLCEAFCRLPKDLAELHIYGPDDQDAAFAHQLRVISDGFDVRFKGTFAKEKMADVLRTVDLLVIPSRWYENSPLVLLNALATHTPVLVSNVAGMTEFVEAGVNGYSFERGSAGDLHAKLSALVSDPSHLYSIAKSTHYERTPASMAQDTLKIYQ
jgi:glycosyltransferase involved in cell wall biosynthesis